MKKFLRQLTLFYFLFSITATLLSGYIAEKFHPSKRIYHALQAAESCPNCTTLILGDSTGEIYDRTISKGELCSARTNRAITLAGQYLLLKSFLSNSKVEDSLSVFLILHPKGLSATLDDKYSFTYFYQPFFTKLIRSELPEDIEQKIPKFKTIINSLLAFPVFRLINFNPLKSQQLKDPRILTPLDYTTQPDFEVPEYSIKSMEQIRLLCAKHKIRLRIVTPILSDEWKGIDLKKFRAPFEACGLEEEISEYGKNSQFLPRTKFLDGVHLKNHVLDSIGNDPLNFFDGPISH